MSLFSHIATHSPQFTLGLSPRVVHFMGLDNSVMTYSYHNSNTQPFPSPENYAVLGLWVLLFFSTRLPTVVLKITFRIVNKFDILTTFIGFSLWTTVFFFFFTEKNTLPIRTGIYFYSCKANSAQSRIL